MKLFALDGPSDFSFADGYDRSEWLVDQAPCRECGQGGAFRDAHPLVLEWEAGSVACSSLTQAHPARVGPSAADAQFGPAASYRRPAARPLAKARVFRVAWSMGMSSRFHG